MILKNSILNILEYFDIHVINIIIDYLLFYDKMILKNIIDIPENQCIFKMLHIDNKLFIVLTIKLSYDSKIIIIDLDTKKIIKEILLSNITCISIAILNETIFYCNYHYLFSDTNHQIIEKYKYDISDMCLNNKKLYLAFLHDKNMISLYKTYNVDAIYVYENELYTLDIKTGTLNIYNLLNNNLIKRIKLDFLMEYFLKISAFGVHVRICINDLYIYINGLLCLVVLDKIYYDYKIYNYFNKLTCGYNFLQPGFSIVGNLVYVANNNKLFVYEIA